VYWFAVVNSASHETDVDDLKQVQARFGSWHQPINALIEATKAGDVSYLPVEELARPLSSYAHDNAVLIGDAAHAMTPNLGQGANQALEDAATLAVLMTRQSPSSEEDLGAALRQYDRLRRRRTQRVARESRGIGTAAQWTFPPAVRLRDMALSAMPNWIFSRRTTRLQQWSPPVSWTSPVAPSTPGKS
jgi:2-polyprenyl-6-methoxyphenol hydroxylase-like FAD-dependent oxidoreductase